MPEFASIQVTGLGELRASLTRLVAELDDPHELLDAIGADLVGNIERRFSAKRDPNGQPWAPLAESTLEWYAEQDKGRRQGTLLERTGQMLASLTHNVEGTAVEVGMNRLTDGGKWAIPLLHETGTDRMPRRGIFLADPDTGALGAEDLADLNALLNEFLDGLLGG